MRHMEGRSMFSQGDRPRRWTVSELLDDGEPPGSRSRAMRVARIFLARGLPVLVREADGVHGNPSATSREHETSAGCRRHALKSR